MMDTISRQAAIEIASDKRCGMNFFDPSEKAIYEVLSDVIHDLFSLPAAHSCETCRYNHLEWFEEPCDSCTVGGESNHWKPKEPERKKGKWIELDYSQAWEYKCDQCGRLSDFEENFCPNCGARMEEEQP